MRMSRRMGIHNAGGNAGDPEPLLITAEGTWVCPKTGYYTIFAVGAGGAGSGGKKGGVGNTSSGLSGGAGGAGYITRFFEKGASVTITTQSTNLSSSEAGYIKFGGYITANYGIPGSAASNPGKAGTVSGNGVTVIPSSNGGKSGYTQNPGGSVASVTIDGINYSSSGGSGYPRNTSVQKGGSGLFGSNGVSATSGRKGGGGGDFGGGGGGADASSSTSGSGGAGGGDCIYILYGADHAITVGTL